MQRMLLICPWMKETPPLFGKSLTPGVVRQEEGLGFPGTQSSPVHPGDRWHQRWHKQIPGPPKTVTVQQTQSNRAWPEDPQVVNEQGLWLTRPHVTTAPRTDVKKGYCVSRTQASAWHERAVKERTSTWQGFSSLCFITTFLSAIALYEFPIAAVTNDHKPTKS